MELWRRAVGMQTCRCGGLEARCECSDMRGIDEVDRSGGALQGQRCGGMEVCNTEVWRRAADLGTWRNGGMKFLSSGDALQACRCRYGGIERWRRVLSVTWRHRSIKLWRRAAGVWTWT